MATTIPSLVPNRSPEKNTLDTTYFRWGTALSTWTVYPQAQCPKGKIAQDASGKWLDRPQKASWGEYPVNDPRRQDWGFLAEVLQRPIAVPTIQGHAVLALKQALVDCAMSRESSHSLVAGAGAHHLKGFADVLGSSEEALNEAASRLLHIRSVADSRKAIANPEKGNSNHALHYWDPLHSGVVTYVRYRLGHALSELRQEKAKELQTESIEAAAENGRELTTEGGYVRTSHSEPDSDPQYDASMLHTDRRIARISNFAAQLGMRTYSLRRTSLSAAAERKLPGFVAFLEKQILERVSELASPAERQAIAGASTISEALRRAPDFAHKVRTHERAREMGVYAKSLEAFLREPEEKTESVAHVCGTWDRAKTATPDELYTRDRPDVPYLEALAGLGHTQSQPRRPDTAAEHVRNLLFSPKVLDVIAPISAIGYGATLRQYLLHQAQTADFAKISARAFLEENLAEWIQDPELHELTQQRLQTGEWKEIQPVDLPAIGRDAAQGHDAMSQADFEVLRQAATAETDQYLAAHPELAEDTANNDLQVRTRRLEPDIRQEVYRFAIAVGINRSQLLEDVPAPQLEQFVRTRDIQGLRRVATAGAEYRRRLAAVGPAREALLRKDPAARIPDAAVLLRQPAELRRIEQEAQAALDQGVIKEVQATLGFADEIEQSVHAPNPETPQVPVTLSPNRPITEAKHGQQYGPEPRAPADTRELAESILAREINVSSAWSERTYDLQAKAEKAAWYQALSPEEKQIAIESFGRAREMHNSGISGDPRLMYESYTKDLAAGTLMRERIQREQALGPLAILEREAEHARRALNPQRAKAYEEVLVRSAATTGKLSLLRADVLSRELPTRHDDGRTAAHIAAENGFLDQLPPDILTLRLLVGIEDREGSSVVHACASSIRGFSQLPRESFTEKLFATQNRDGNTPLHDAARWRTLATIPPEYLTTAACAVANLSGDSVFHVAAASKTYDQLPEAIAVANLPRQNASGKTVESAIFEADLLKETPPWLERQNRSDALTAALRQPSHEQEQSPMEEMFAPANNIEP